MAQAKSKSRKEAARGKRAPSPRTATKAKVRNLRAADLDAVVAIDRAWVGRARRGFFEKRLEAVRKAPNTYVTLGVEEGGQLAGYVIAQIGRGEFGVDATTAAVDAVGVDKSRQGQGLGRALIAGLNEALGKAGVETVFSQTDWTNRGLLDFFAAAGFSLAPRALVERSIDNGAGRETALEPAAPEDWSGDDSGELDFSDPSGDDFTALARDRVPIRSMAEEDLDDIIDIDHRITGHDRETYFRLLMAQALADSGVRVSLVAVLDDRVVGFIMARVDYGEFGRTEPVAVMDTIGIHPDHQHHDIGSALMSQLLMNLSGLMIDRVRTVVDWDGFELLGFLARNGFEPAQRLALWRQMDRPDG